MCRTQSAVDDAEVPKGFTYIGLLIAIAVMGVGLAAAGPVSRTLQLREMEKELLFAGDSSVRLPVRLRSNQEQDEVFGNCT